MGAKIVPFPLSRRRDFISRQARRALELDPVQAEKHIQQQLNCQRAAFRRRGIGEDTINDQLRGMEAAIRSAMWASVFGEPKGAR